MTKTYKCPNCNTQYNPSELWEYADGDEESFFDCPNCQTPLLLLTHVDFTLKKDVPITVEATA